MFRKTKINDLISILNIENSVFSNPWTKDQLIHELTSVPSASHWVLTKKDSLVGFIMSHVVENEVQIINIAVDLKFQCRGFGKKILSLFLSKFQMDTFFFLEVKTSNLPAIQLYNHFGFTQIDIRKKYYFDGEDAMVMSKTGTKIPQEVLNTKFELEI